MGSSADIGILTTDAKLVVRTWDDWIAAATGVSRDQAIGRPVVEVLPDLATRSLLARVQEAATTGTVQVLAPALHHYLIACPPRVPSARFTHMQQRVTIGPLRDGDAIVGVVIAVEDVTARLEAERDLAEALAASEQATGGAVPNALAAENWRERKAAVDALARTADKQFLEALIATLREDHRNFALLSSAIKLLSMTNVDVTASLAALLKHEDHDLRIQAALALGEQATAEAIPPLVEALGDPDQNVQFQAIESLGHLRAEAAVDALSAIVESRDYFLSFAALDALAAIQDSRVVPRLVPLLAEEALRVPVADALGAIGDDTVVAPLVDALNASDHGAVSIVSALARIHDRCDREFQDGARIADLVAHGINLSGRAHIIAAVANASDDDLPRLARVLGWLRGPDISQALTRLLAASSVRGVVIEALARHGEGVVDLLVEQLDSDDRETRHAAIVALGRLSSRRATPALLALLDGEPQLTIAAAGALARIGDRSAFEPLLGRLGHPDAGVRQSVIGALNSMGHPDLGARVEELLVDPNPLVRESAVRIAGYFGFSNTVDLLFERARDEDEAVRRVILEHLGFLDDRRVVPTLLDAFAHDTPRVRAAAIRALGHVDAAVAADVFVRALDDEDAWVRYYAARSIAERGESAALEALVRHAQSDPAAQVRIAVIDAIGELRAHAAIETLQVLASDPHDEVAAAALGALGRLTEDDGLPQLLHALRADAPTRRAAAIRALASHRSAAAVSSLEWTAAADPDPQIARAAIEALGLHAAGNGTAGAAALDALLLLLSDSSRREMAAGTLAHLPPSCIQELSRGLRHPQPEVRSGTVEALGRLQHRDASRLIVDALQDADAMVRETAVVTLARLGARGLGPMFASLAAQDPSKRVRRAATTALARLRD